MTATVKSGSATLAETSSGTALTVAVPADVAAGDILLLAVAAGGGSITSSLPGWTTLATQVVSANAAFGVFYRTATAAEPASYTLNALTSTAQKLSAELVAVSGVDSSTPLDVPAATATSKAVTAPTVTTTTDGAAVLYVVSEDSASSSDLSVPAGVTLVKDSTGVGKRLVTAFETQATAGTTTARTFTETGTTGLSGGATTVAFRPAATVTSSSGSGVSAPLPATLHAWNPVVLSGPAQSRTLALTAGPTVGRSQRSGTGTGRVLSLLSGVAGGIRRMSAPAPAARALPLTPGTGDGVVRAIILGTGAAYPLAGLSTNGQGVKRARGYASPQAYPFPGGTANGRSSKRGSGRAFLLVCRRGMAVGGKHTAGTGRGFPLTRHGLDQKNWVHNVHREFFYDGPTDVVHDYMAAPLSRRFVASTRVGLTTWRDATGWHVQYRPDPAVLLAAEVVLAGGRVNRLTDDLRASLTDAGLDPYITLQEVRP